MADKHTPGPWRTGREDMQSYDGATGKPFASVYCDDDRAGMHLGKKLPYDIARTFGDECKANARLIAAAPELLATLEHTYNYLIGLHAYLLSCENSVIVDNLESTSAFAYKHAELCEFAIRKAKGE